MQKAIDYAIISHLILKSQAHTAQDLFWFPVLAGYLCSFS